MVKPEPARQGVYLSLHYSKANGSQEKMMTFHNVHQQYGDQLETTQNLPRKNCQREQRQCNGYSLVPLFDIILSL